MGCQKTFECERCKYSAIVSGAADAGEECCTDTILCIDCRELYDVVSAEGRSVKGAMDFVEVPVVCPKFKEHRWRLWIFPDACPKCGGLMKQTVGIVMLWD